MSSIITVVRYQELLEPVKQAVGLCRGLEQVKAGMRVFIKPNIVFWTKTTAFSKLGVITTSRAVEDMVIVLKKRRFGVLLTADCGLRTADCGLRD